MNYTQFTEVLQMMIPHAVADARAPHNSRYGKPLRSNDWPVVDVLVRLPPSYMLEVARNPKLVPAEYDGLPVRIAEAPSRVNKPSGRYMISVMARKEHPDTGLPSHGRGRVTLSEEFG